MRIRLSRPNAIFWVLYLVVLLWCYHNSSDDPGSAFYRPHEAFSSSHSRQREAEVDAYIGKVAASTVPITTTASAQMNEYLCIGIPSVNRTRPDFLARTLGSLTDTLSPAERAGVHIVVLLADRAPQLHTAYGQPWLSRLADDVLVYDSDGIDLSELPAKSDPDDAYRIIKWDVLGRGRGDNREENIRLDHSILVDACRQRTGNPYFALIEDDVMASRDWFRRLAYGVTAIELRTRETGREWLYLRLFHSEFFMGWNSEEAMVYLKYIFGFYVVLSAVLLITLRRRRRRGGLKGGQSPSAQSISHIMAMALGLWTPACIALFFLAGRVTWHRLLLWHSPVWNPAPNGVREMPQYGCCAQGLVYPYRQLDGLQRILRSEPWTTPGDMLVETHAEQKELVKWALDPSVLQHAGIAETEDGGETTNVWNFSFERMG